MTQICAVEKKKMRLICIFKGTNKQKEELVCNFVYTFTS